MVLRRDVAARASTSTTSAVAPDADEVERLFDFLEFRTLVRPPRRGARRRARRRHRRPATSARSWSPRSRRSTTPADAGRRCSPALDGARRRRPPGPASRAAARSPASPSSPTPSPAEVAWIPATLLADDRGGASRSPARPAVARPQRQAADALAARPRASTLHGLELDTAIAAYLLDPAEARYELGRPARALHRRSPLPADDAGRRGPARPRRHRRRRRRRAPAATRSPSHRLVEPITAQPRRAGHGRAVRRRSRTRSCVVLARMEHVGIAVDVAELRALDAAAHRRGRSGSAPSCRTVVGRDDFNVNSPIQLREILFDERGLTPAARRPRPGYSTDAATLEKLQDQWPEFIGPLLQYREVEKLRGTYGEGLLAEVARRRAHPRHVQPDRRPHRPAVSSDRPNLHNIPVRTRRGPAVPQGVRAGARATSCSSPTTTRSSCAASPTSPPTRA